MNHPFLKLCCYVLVLVLFEFIARTENITSDIIATYTWWDWLKFIAVILAPAALVVRTYTDGSLPRYLAERERKQNEN